jgi:hypothetical protein
LLSPSFVEEKNEDGLFFHLSFFCLSFFDISFFIYYFSASLLFPLTKADGCMMAGDEGYTDTQ